MYILVDTIIIVSDTNIYLIFTMYILVDTIIIVSTNISLSLIL